MVVDLSKYLNVYKFNAVLPGSGLKINFKPITTYQMKELLSFDGDDPEDALDNLISSCVIDEGFDVKKISLQDRFFLMVELRKKSKGSDYQINYICGKCKSQVMTVADLDKLVVKKIDKKLDYKVKLDDNISVEVSLLSREAQLEAIRMVKEMLDYGTAKEKAKYIEETVMGYILSIKKIITPDGEIEASLDNKIMLFREGPQFFYDRLVEWYDKLDFGVDFTIPLKCPHCQDEQKIDIPLANFFV
jgi:hypothetical protein